MTGNAKVLRDIELSLFVSHNGYIDVNGFLYMYYSTFHSNIWGFLTLNG